jgi:indole-3-glycerol phosphate synthase/phosphoribosylanthranilate isomerase
VKLPEIAAAYEAHGSAISVLTDATFFGGSHERMAALRAMVHLPVLCKDFVVDPYQVHEARLHGADAILLMLSVLSDDAYLACRDAANQHRMAVLTEVHTEEELARAVALEAPIIGINNRDLKTLEVDLGVTERLAANIPEDRVVISESGLADHTAVRRLRGKVDGFLVGTSLMRQPDLAHATRALIYGVTKVCGLTRTEDAATAHVLGATHGGLIFAPESPRRVSEELAGQLRRAAPLHWVGVFVNAPAEEVGRLADALDLAAVQLHGEESPEMVAALRKGFNGAREVWKAVRVKDRVPSLAETRADRLMLDSFDARAHGGTGKRFNWNLLAGNPELDRMILGGGLNAESVRSAEAIGTWGLDVNSGVERAPGRKDPSKLAHFLDARRGARREQGVLR